MGIIRKHKLTVVATATTLALTGTVAFGAIGPAADGTIYACVNTTTGAIRMLDPSTTSCPSGETRTWWNQRGRQGPTGYPGPKGDTGPAGKDGDSKKQWLRMGAHGEVQATNNTGVQTYDVRSNGGTAYVYFPGYDTPEKCSLTVTPVLTDGSRQVIAFRVPYTNGYWSRFQTTEGGRAVAVPVDVVLHCA